MIEVLVGSAGTQAWICPLQTSKPPGGGRQSSPASVCYIVFELELMEFLSDLLAVIHPRASDPPSLRWPVN